MVLATETYAESAARELEEELGVSGVELTAHDHFFFEDTGNRLWCSAFSAVWDGPLILQPEEVLEARFIPVDQVLLEIQQKPYCPDSLAALKRYLGSRKNGVAKEA
jgi:ADP-ribose pyrophosphatase YjhB (NUDIX family)